MNHLQGIGNKDEEEELVKYIEHLNFAFSFAFDFDVIKCVFWDMFGTTYMIVSLHNHKDR